MQERRQQSFIKEHDMDDLRSRLNRIEQQGVDAKVEAKVLDATFTAHQVQNAKDFKHVDECIHRAEEESVRRDADTLEIVKEIRTQFEEVKQLVWKASGALLVIVPVVNYIVGKYL